MSKMLCKEAIIFFQNDKDRYYFQNNELYNLIIKAIHHAVNTYLPILVTDLRLEGQNILINFDYYSIDTNNILVSRGLCEHFMRKMFNVNISVNIIIMLENHNNILGCIFTVIKTIAHELRHVYQYLYRTDIGMDAQNIEDYTSDYEYYNDPDEMDARAYADYFIRKYIQNIYDWVEIYYPELFKIYVQNVCDFMIAERMNNISWKED